MAVRLAKGGSGRNRKRTYNLPMQKKMQSGKRIGKRSPVTLLNAPKHVRKMVEAAKAAHQAKIERAKEKT